MTKKIQVNPVDLIYIDDAELCSGTQEEEFQDLYDSGMEPEDMPDDAYRAAYEAFLKRNGYEL